MKYPLLIIALAAAVVAALILVTPREDSALKELSRSLNVDEVQTGSEAGHDPAAGSSRLHNGGGEARLYRWRNDQGRWSYGDRPPPGVNAEPVELGETQRLAPPAAEDQ